MNFWERSLQVYGLIIACIVLALILLLVPMGCATRPDVCTVNDRLLGDC